MRGAGIAHGSAALAELRNLAFFAAKKCDRYHVLFSVLCSGRLSPPASAGAASAMRSLLVLLGSLVLVAGQQGAPLFTISIDVGGDAPEELAVRDGDVPSRIADVFAQQHGLNDRGA